MNSLDRKSEVFNTDIKSRDHRLKKESIEIDMNPMVDLAFLLLTFFMLTTTFSQPQAMELVMPVKPDKLSVEKEQPIKESRTLTLILDKNDKIIWFRGITDPEVSLTDYSAEGVREILLKSDREIDKMVVLIKPTDESNYKNLVDILDEMQITEIDRYSIVNLTQDDRNIISEQRDA